MSIEKSITVAPKGIEEAALEEKALEIEIVDPEMVTLDDGSVEITLIPEDNISSLAEFGVNLVDILDEKTLSVLAEEVVSSIEADKDSRKDWADTYAKGLEIIGFKYEERTTPWENACGVHSTVLAEAAIRFQAETMSETFPAGGPVRVKILGKETPEKIESAERVKNDMNYELTETMVEYRPEHERMLYSLGLAGSAFKKVYFDPNIGRQVAIYIPAEDVIVPYGASDIESAERVTHVMRRTKNDILKLQANGFYSNIELYEPSPYHSDIEEKKAEDGGYSLIEDGRYTLYETHADLIIEGVDGDDGISKPYIVTIIRDTNEILAIRRNWNEGDPLMLKRQHFVHYVYVPGFGFYGLGLIHIVGGYARAGTSIIRQLVDCGTLANLPGGLKTRGLRIKGDDTPIEPGEFKDVDVPSGSIRENIMPLPYKEPSQTLLALLNRITDEGRRLGAISDITVSDMSANAPVGTTLALLERTLKPMAAVQARVHYAMKQEFKMLKAIMAEYAPEQYEYMPTTGEPIARRIDYMSVDVIPVSDPNSSTMAQRVVQYQAVLQMAQQFPQIYDLPQLHRQMIEVLGIKNADKLVPIQDDLKPVDPISENMNVLMSKPVKAFIEQDHEAHLLAHESFLQDPMILGAMQKNPRGKAILATLHAHIAEHVAYNYRSKVEEQVGAEMPAPNLEFPETLAANIAGVVGKAARDLSAKNAQEQAQKQAMAKAKDPVVQIQKADLQIRQQEAQRKAAKDAADAQVKQQELAIKEKQVQSDALLDIAKLEMEKEKNSANLEKEGIKVGAQIIKDTKR
jgi:hypothetical protein